MAICQVVYKTCKGIHLMLMKVKDCLIIHDEMQIYVFVFSHLLLLNRCILCASLRPMAGY